MKNQIKVLCCYLFFKLLDYIFDFNAYVHICFLIIYITLQVIELYKKYTRTYNPPPLYLTIPAHLAHLLPTIPQGIMVKYTVELPPIHIH